jgi:hypothetical protein
MINLMSQGGKMRVSALLVAGIILTAANQLPAAVPQLINFQSLVTDNVGDPIPNGTYSAVFSIYDSELGGTLLWTETNNAVSVSSSRFNVLLGAIEPLHDSVFDGTDRWLQVQFDGEILAPRTRLVSVGYAHRISTVDGASGGEIAGRVGITATSSQAALYVVQHTPGAWTARFENTSLVASEPAVLGVNNGAAPGVWGFNPWGGPGVNSTGALSVSNLALSDRIVANPYGSQAGGDLYLYQNNGDKTVELLATETANEFGQINLYKNNIRTIAISGGNASQAGDIVLYDDSGNPNIFIDGESSSGGGRFVIYNGAEANAGGVSSGYMQLGSVAGPNLLLDNDEIMARNSGVSSPLHLQRTAGAVLIGCEGITPPSGYILVVDGKAMLEEVEVQLSADWPDYVFEDDYQMLTIDELAAHVKEHKHLPGIPRADQMNGQSVPLGEMQTKLLEKMEELTLYMIQLKSDLNQAQLTNEELRSRIDELEAGRN